MRKRVLHSGWKDFTFPYAEGSPKPARIVPIYRPCFLKAFTKLTFSEHTICGSVGGKQGTSFMKWRKLQNCVCLLPAWHRC